jgi:predicted sulfurtransferase
VCLESDKLEMFKEVLGKLGVEQDQLSVKVQEQDQLRVKVHLADINLFRKLRLRQGKLDDDADISETGEHLDREGWNKVLDVELDSLVLDIWNGYEWDVGRFRGG